MNYLVDLTVVLQKIDLSLEQFYEFLNKSDTHFKDNELEIKYLLDNGYPLEIKDGTVKLTTTHTKIKDQVFVVVDIETTASNVKKGQLIEIGAIKYQNGKIIDKFQSLINIDEIPPYIENLTGITAQMCADAPDVRVALEDFQIFLEDSVFIAHDVKFDYKFLSQSFQKYGFGFIANRKICTINLAKKFIKAEKYGLRHLKELLDIDVPTHHRAYDDAIATIKIFEYCLEELYKINANMYVEDMIKRYN